MKKPVSAATKAYRLQWQRENKEKCREYRKRYVANHREKELERVRKYHAENRESIRERQRRNKGYGHSERVARRKAQKISAEPTWLSEEHRQQLRDIYTFRPKGYHVDHIIPLKGKDVCGLHVPWNMQYLPATENLKKGNRW